MARYAVTHLKQIEELSDGRQPYRPVRHHFGITTFGAIATTAPAAGGVVVNEHDEAEPESSEELYVVISGRARFELDGESKDAPAGTFVHVPAGIKRTAIAQEANTTVLAIGGAPPGRPYKPSGWELAAPLFALHEAEKYEEAADGAQSLLADDPPYGALYYNTACFEALAGRPDDALAHLRRALELMPELTTLVRDDDDLRSLRERPEFTEILGG